MTGNSLVYVFQALFCAGVVRSKRDFSRRFLGRGVTYLRDFEQRERMGVRVPPRTVVTLHRRLEAIVRLLPPEPAHELLQVLGRIERDCRIVTDLGYVRCGRR